MNVIKTDIEGVVIIEPRIFPDSRGYFFESYNKEVFDREVTPVDFVQDNESCSTRGILYLVLLALKRSLLLFC